jgi:transglutaminase/protease-like cytokinesis protein 3
MRDFAPSSGDNKQPTRKSSHRESTSSSASAVASASVSSTPLSSNQTFSGDAEDEEDGKDQYYMTLIALRNYILD